MFRVRILYCRSIRGTPRQGDHQGVPPEVCCTYAGPNPPAIGIIQGCGIDVDGQGAIRIIPDTETDPECSRTGITEEPGFEGFIRQVKNGLSHLPGIWSRLPVVVEPGVSHGGKVEVGLADNTKIGAEPMDLQGRPCIRRLLRRCLLRHRLLTSHKQQHQPQDGRTDEKPAKHYELLLPGWWRAPCKARSAPRQYLLGVKNTPVCYPRLLWASRSK